MTTRSATDHAVATGVVDAATHAVTSPSVSAEFLGRAGFALRAVRRRASQDRTTRPAGEAGR